MALKASMTQAVAQGFVAEPPQGVVAPTRHRVPEESVALVPFVRTVAPETAPPPVSRPASLPAVQATWGELALDWLEKLDGNRHRLYESYIRSMHVRFLLWTSRQALQLAWYLPIVAGYALLAFALRSLLFVTRNPDKLVVKWFELMDAAFEAGPSYVQFAFEKVTGQIYNETTARFR